MHDGLHRQKWLFCVYPSIQLPPWQIEAQQVKVQAYCLNMSNGIQSITYLSRMVKISCHPVLFPVVFHLKYNGEWFKLIERLIVGCFHQNTHYPSPFDPVPLADHHKLHCPVHNASRQPGDPRNQSESTDTVDPARGADCAHLRHALCTLRPSTELLRRSLDGGGAVGLGILSSLYALPLCPPTRSPISRSSDSIATTPFRWRLPLHLSALLKSNMVWD